MPTPYYDRNGITIYHSRWQDITLAEQPALTLSDPPYGDDHDTDYTRFTGGVAASFSRHAAIAGDNEPFDPRPLLKIGRQQILFGANRYSDSLPCGSWLIWDKRTPGGRKNVMSDAEVAWWSRGRGVYLFKHTWDGFNRASERGTAYHPAQKPTALMLWCIQKARLRAGSLVFDPFMGCGPVARAAKSLGMRFIGCDVDERYCKIAVELLGNEMLPAVPALVNDYTNTLFEGL